LFSPNPSFLFQILIFHFKKIVRPFFPPSVALIAYIARLVEKIRAAENHHILNFIFDQFGTAEIAMIEEFSCQQLKR
jgi:hypothetical protein